MSENKKNNSSDNDLDKEDLQIDDFLLDSQKTDFIKQKKSRQKGKTIRGISSEKPLIFKKRLVIISLFLVAVFAVIQLFSPPDEKYIDDSSFNKIDVPVTEQSTSERESGMLEGDLESRKRPSVDRERRSKRRNIPSALSKRRRATKSYQERKRDRDEVISDSRDVPEYERDEFAREESPRIRRERSDDKLLPQNAEEKEDVIEDPERDVRAGEDDEYYSYENDSPQEPREPLENEYEEDSYVEPEEEEYY